MKNKFRLPTIQELHSILNHSKYEPSCSFKDTKSSHYWSSTTDVSNTSYAWLVYFNDGYTYGDNKVSYNYVRCVRTLANGTLQWSKSSENRMDWYEAFEYVKTLTKKDIYYDTRIR